MSKTFTHFRLDEVTFNLAIERSPVHMKKVTVSQLQSNLHYERLVLRNWRVAQNDLHQCLDLHVINDRASYEKLIF